MARVAERGFRARRGLDAAAEIDAPHGLVAHHLFGAAFGDAFADIHGDHAVDQAGDALHVVIDQQHGAAVVAQFADEIGEGRGFRRGQAGERLVDQQHLRIARDRLGDFDLAQVGERQRGRAPVEHGAQADARGDGAGALVGLRVGEQPGELVGQQRELDVFQHGLAMQRTRMLKHDAGAHARDPVRRPAGDLDAVDAHRAGIGAFDAHDQLHHRRFAGAVGADQAQNLAGARRQSVISFTATRPPKRLVRPVTSRWARSGMLMRRPWCA